MKKLLLILFISSIGFGQIKILQFDNGHLASVKDSIKGAVTICGVVWSTKNLDVDHYRNGDSIPQCTNDSVWTTLTTGAWCYYNNDPANGEIYGKLYNWYAVDDPRGLAPSGWHIPTYNEWYSLGDSCLGGNYVSGKKLKTSDWGGTNEVGFTALPGGYRMGANGQFYQIGLLGIWLTQDNYGIGFNCYSSSDGFWLFSSDKSNGFSVRLVKD